MLPLIALEREYQLVGVKTSGDRGPLDTVRKCLRFELDYETVSPFLSEDVSGSGILHDRVMKLVLEPDLPSGNLMASQAHEVLDVAAQQAPRVRYDRRLSAQPFTVSNLSFHMHFVLRRNAKSAPPITGVALTVDPGEVTGDMVYVDDNYVEISGEPTYHCAGDTVPDYGGACWVARHVSERIRSTTTFVIKLDYVGTALFARKTYDLPCTLKLVTEASCSVGDSREKTTFDMRHAPAN